MPVYEKGSVRAEPRSNKQERMKKIMKKFLSSLLALTMILSLVIVPANAADDDTVSEATLSKTETTLSKGSEETLTLTTTSAKLIANNSVELTAGTADWSTSNSSVATVDRSGKITAVGKGTATITCVANFTYTQEETPTTPENPAQQSTTTASAKQTLTCEVTVNDAFLASDVKSVTVFGRTYTVSNGKATVYTYDDEDLTAAAAGWHADTATGYDYDKAEYSGKKLKVTVSNSDLTTKYVEITINSSKNSEPDLTVNTATQVLEGSKVTLTVSNADKVDISNCKYTWSYKGSKDASATTITSTKNTSYDWNLGSLPVDTYTVTCEANYGDAEEVATKSFTLTVLDEDIYHIQTTKDTYTLQAGNKLDLSSKVEFVRKQDDGTTSGDLTSKLNIKYKFESKSRDIATVGETSGEVTGVSDGKATITITATYSANGAKKEYTKDVTVKVSSLSATFEKSVENGDNITYDNDDVMDAAAAAINNVFGKNTVSANGIDSVKIKAADSKEGDVYVGNDKVKTSETLGNDDLTFDAKEGFIGTASFKAEVETSKSIDGQTIFEVVLKVPVTSAGDIKETVTGSSANSSVSFKVNDVVDYDKVYLRGSVSGTSSNRTFTPSSLASSNYDGYWDGNAKSGSGWALFDDTDTVTIPASAFSKTTGKATLYVIGLDKYDVAYTGTIEVSQKSYTIEYNVVAGDSVDFKQADFDDFMDDYADDNISINKGDYFEFDYVKFTIPNSTSGTLYEGSSKIKASDEISDLDKVSFDSTAKAKGTINISFTLYAKRYDKNDKVVEKKVAMPGTVVISVVNEDIVYEVGVNSSVGFKASDFQSFLNSSSKRATLSYVTFDVGSNKAVTSYFSGTGALYRYYSAYGVNSTVTDKDEFYYNSKSSKNYDLDDVTYVTSRFAKTGDIVYIPFTAYGTRNEKAEGTVAIKVKQTMNFTDVHTYDYFYDAVQWAVNKDITKGTSATTFSPKTGCTRAMIVTFLWRAADSPEPRSNSNKFTDVSATKHADYMKAILWATEQGITTGTGNNKFSPDATCTRAMIVTFLYRYKNSPAVYGSLNFTDVSKTTHSAYYNAILWAVNNKVTTGYGNGIFDPNGTCNRGDAVTFLYRALA